MKLVGFYHIYLPDEPSAWFSMVMEQFKILEDHELLDALDELNVNVICKIDDRAPLFDELIRLYYPKANIRFLVSRSKDDSDMMNNISDENQPSENNTMRLIYEKAHQEDCRILYFHSKGITSILKHYKKDEMHLLRNYQYWRYYLNWGVLENWKECVNSLDSHDVAGVNYFTYPAKHFSGAFWWTTSDWIKKLPDPSTKDWWYDLKSKATDHWLRNIATDRFRDEQWLCCRDDVRVYTVDQNNNNPALDNPANFFHPRKNYKQKSIL